MPYGRPRRAWIDECGAALFVKNAVLDYETRSQYHLMLTVRDDGTPPLMSVATITVRLNDVNEPPVLRAAPGLAVAENAAPGASAGGMRPGAINALCSAVPAEFAVQTTGASAPSFMHSTLKDSAAAARLSSIALFPLPCSDF